LPETHNINQGMELVGYYPLMPPLSEKHFDVFCFRATTLPSPRDSSLGSSLQRLLPPMNRLGSTFPMSTHDGGASPPPLQPSTGSSSFDSRLHRPLQIFGTWVEAAHPRLPPRWAPPADPIPIVRRLTPTKPSPLAFLPSTDVVVPPLCPCPPFVMQGV
jgi:hypothetical protein